MTLRVRDPLAEINKPPDGRRIRTLEAVHGRRLGFLWSQHASSEKFWPVFERVAQQVLKPSEVHRLYKKSTWNVAPAEEIEELTSKVDYVLVGAGG